MVRVVTRTRSATPPSGPSAPVPPPTPDIGVASAPEQVPSSAYPQGVQVPVVVNNFISLVSDEADLAQQRREFLARQREERQVPQAPPRRAQRVPASTAATSQTPVSTTTAEDQTRGVKNWAQLAQEVFFRAIKRRRCRELQKRWEACMKLRNRLANHAWEKTRSSDWAVAEGFKGSQPKKRPSVKPARAKGGLGSESSDEDPVRLIL